jgi:energy-coupling factor transport system substrate-specific component
VIAVAVFIGLGAEYYSWWAWAIALPLWVVSPVLFTWIGRTIAVRLTKAGVAQAA